MLLRRSCKFSRPDVLPFAIVSQAVKDCCVQLASAVQTTNQSFLFEKKNTEDRPECRRHSFMINRLADYFLTAAVATPPQ